MGNATKFDEVAGLLKSLDNMFLSEVTDQTTYDKIFDSVYGNDEMSNTEHKDPKNYEKL